MSDKTTISLEINPENLTDKEREMLMSLVEKASGKSDERYPKPKNGDKYWYVDSRGEVCGMYWANDMGDRMRHNMHNCYLLKEVCEFEAERLKVIAELKNYSFKPDWKDFDQKKYFFYYDYKSKVFIKTYNTYARYDGVIYFQSMDVLEQAVEAVGKKRIKKYLFEVE